MFDYGRGRELHIAKSIEATKLTTRAGKIAPRVLADRTVLIDAEYFRVERIPGEGSQKREGLRGGEAPGFAYFFAAFGTGRRSGQGFKPIDLPGARGCRDACSVAVVCVRKDRGAAEGKLYLIRITPNWPG